MTTKDWMRSWAVVTMIGMLGGGAAHGAAFTADEAVKVALKGSTQMVNAEADLLAARGGVHGALGSILPNLSLAYSYTPTYAAKSVSSQYVGTNVFDNPISDVRGRSTGYSVSTSWGIADLSAWTGWAAARQGLRASRLRRDAARSDVALATRRQFYAVVQAIKLAEVADGALRLARDDERRVKAMFEVGSVSKSDLLKSQVRTAQSEFDQLSAQHTVTVQRVALASVMGIKESELGEVDTLLVATPQTYDEASLLSEAAKNRPDLVAAAAELDASRASFQSARMGRLPFLALTGTATFDPRFRQDFLDTGAGTRSQSDVQLRGSVSLNWNVFDLRTLDANIASTRARLDRAREAHDALQRNLASEVHQQLLAYTEAVEQDKVAQRGLESATENLKLTQEKYKVGSATILELIDAQVQLQTAQSNVVKALAAIRVAEAQINRVRGRGE